MMDVHELLRTKENQVARVREEIKALHIVASLLGEPHPTQPKPDSEFVVDTLENGSAEEASAQDEPSLSSGDISLQPIPPKRNRLRDWLGLAVGQ